MRGRLLHVKGHESEASRSASCPVSHDHYIRDVSWVSEGMRYTLHEQTVRPLCFSPISSRTRNLHKAGRRQQNPSLLPSLTTAYQKLHLSTLRPRGRTCRSSRQGCHLCSPASTQLLAQDGLILHIGQRSCGRPPTKTLKGPPPETHGMTPAVTLCSEKLKPGQGQNDPYPAGRQDDRVWRTDVTEGQPGLQR